MFVFVILFLSIHRFTTTYLKFNISEQLCRFYSKNGRAFSAWPYPYFEQGYSFPWDKKTTNFFKIFNVQYWNKSADLKMRLLSIYRASYLTAHLVRRIYDELKKNRRDHSHRNARNRPHFPGTSELPENSLFGEDFDMINGSASFLACL